MKKLSQKEKNILRQNLVDFAEKFVGIPYKYGATLKDAPQAFDCSGFIQYVYKNFGYEIPRSTILQAEFAGKKVKNIEDLKSGDLLFFHSNSGHYNKKFPQGIGHVAMYIGDNKVIHASAKRIATYPRIIEKGSVEIKPLKLVIKKSLVVIKRII